jgi:uncharacterized membrane protein
MFETFDLHPAVSGASLAFILLLLCLDVINWVRERSLYEGGGVILWAAGIALITTFFSGYLSHGFLFPPDDLVIRDAIARHHVIGRSALIVLPIVVVLRRLAFSRRTLLWIIGYGSAILGLAATLVIGGAMGGRLVFYYGVGVATVNR